MSYRFGSLLLLIIVANSYSDITMLNCPAQFDINKFNSTADKTV